jgi:hypothetical protein
MENNIKKYYLSNLKMNEFTRIQSKKKLQNSLFKKINDEISTINDDKKINDNQQIKQIKNKNTNSKKLIPRIANTNKIFESEKKKDKIIDYTKNNSINNENNDINENKSNLYIKKKYEITIKKYNRYEKT